MHAILLTLLLAMDSLAAGNDASRFKTGKELATALAVEVRWSSIGAELADQLRDLQNQSAILILRDRRIDPHRLTSVQTEFVSRGHVLRQLAGTIPDGGFCLTDNLAYVGTTQTTHRLPVLLDQKNREAEAIRKTVGAVSFHALTAKIDVAWEDLSEPRHILQDHALIAGMTLANPEAVPYDLWAAGHFPRMTFVELATVILNQFDLTFDLAADRPEITVVAIDPNTIFEHLYLVGTRLKSDMTAAWKQELPEIEIHWAGPNATITTTLQQHALLYAMLQDEIYNSSSKDSTSGTPKTSIRTTNYQLSAKRATVGQLIQFFRGQGVTIEVRDEDAPELKTILNEIVDLAAHTERQPGLKLFPLIFGMQFRRVDVLDDRVVLSLE